MIKIKALRSPPNKVKPMSQTPYIPSWWPQALAVEYLPCRDFTKGERISKVDFSMISKDMIDSAIAQHKIVAFGTLIQNVDPATFQARSVLALVSPITKPVVNQDKDAIIPNGIVSKHHFPQLVNAIDVCDPIESFNSHIQVLDKDVLYQWEIARFEGVAGRHYGRWVSDFTDLSEFDHNHEFQALMRYKASTDFRLEMYVDKAREYIEKLQRLRLKAFDDLQNVHEDFKKRDKLSKMKVVAYKPPALSHFETMKIENGEIHTTCFIAPIFYRAALKHCVASKKYVEGKPVTHPHMLDEIYEERAQAIIMGVACLEAVANEIGSLTHSENWHFLQKLTLIEKFQFMYSSCSPSVPFDTSKHPFQFMAKIVGSRNEMIHFKSGYSKCKVIGDAAASKMESILSFELIDKLPSVLGDSIMNIYLTLNLPEPLWIKNQVGWKVT